MNDQKTFGPRFKKNHRHFLQLLPTTQGDCPELNVKIGTLEKELKLFMLLGVKSRWPMEELSIPWLFTCRISKICLNCN